VRLREKKIAKYTDDWKSADVVANRFNVVNVLVRLSDLREGVLREGVLRAACCVPRACVQCVCHTGGVHARVAIASHCPAHSA
jgi:hypothetical protein